MPLTVDLAGLRADIERLAEIGTISGHPGINRPSFSTEDTTARHWFMQRCTAAGPLARLAVERSAPLRLVST